MEAILKEYTQGWHQYCQAYINLYGYLNSPGADPESIIRFVKILYENQRDFKIVMRFLRRVKGRVKFDYGGASFRMASNDGNDFIINRTGLGNNDHHLIRFPSSLWNQDSWQKETERWHLNSIWAGRYMVDFVKHWKRVNKKREWKGPTTLAELIEFWKPAEVNSTQPEDNGCDCDACVQDRTRARIEQFNAEIGLRV